MKKLIFAAMFAAAFGLSAAEANLALNKTATASSTQDNKMVAKNAVDGKSGTRWSSAFSDAQWIMVDLGSNQKVGKVVLSWEAAAGKDFKIQVSKDGKTWKDVAVKKDGKGGKETFTFKQEDARYVRMFGEKRKTQFGYSLWEFEVYAK